MSRAEAGRGAGEELRSKSVARKSMESREGRREGFEAGRGQRGQGGQSESGGGQRRQGEHSDSGVGHRGRTSSLVWRRSSEARASAWAD